MALTWFRFHADALDNPRLQKLDPALFKIWVNLQCILAHEKMAASGKLPDAKEVAFRLRMSVEETVNNLDLLVEEGLLKVKSGTLGNGNGDENRTDGNGNGLQKTLEIFSEKKEYFLRNWEKKQYKSDTSTERTKRFRQRHGNATGTPPDQIRSDTDQIISEAGVLNKNMDKEKVSRIKRYSGHYDILKHLTGEELDKAREKAAGWDIYHLATKYNTAIKEGRMQEPVRPEVAFPAWCASYTKGNPP